MDRPYRIVFLNKVKRKLKEVIDQKYLDFRDKIIIENYRFARVKIGFMRTLSKEKLAFCRAEIA